MMETLMKALLEKLNIRPVNAGASTGADGWLMDSKGRELVSYNPTTGEALATFKLHPNRMRKSPQRRKLFS